MKKRIIPLPYFLLIFFPLPPMIIKYRPRSTASIPYLLAGECRRSVSTSISKFASFTTGIRRSSGRFYGQGFQSGRGEHTSSCEDDFLELGPPVQETGGKLKLATEKPEFRLKVNPVPKAKPSHYSSENTPGIWSSVIKNFQAPKTKPRDQKDTSSLAVKQNQGSKSGNPITIKEDRSKNSRDTVNNIASKFSLSDWDTASSASGKVSSAHVRRSPDNLNSCDTQFMVICHSVTLI
ncbi:OLC1v1004425C1 [Oldenlandia corymbosa var. corymbosa]|uniref:OLC1v1004425C1 n=1 Tax=Oldenlandia corymbosa var. corymbosa TaxID=529605 RepID=A0AAV1DC91_OLDCO|nr:OLC1v1004425C1 [Oldenlandia corymbosa var. corymbosa]